MSGLRPVIIEALYNAFEHGAKGKPYVSEPDITAILDAVIEALPERLVQTKDEVDTDWFYGHGNNQAIDQIKAILTASKTKEEK